MVDWRQIHISLEVGLGGKPWGEDDKTLMELDADALLKARYFIKK